MNYKKYSEFRFEKPRNDNFKIDCGNYALFFPSNDFFLLMIITTTQS